MRREWNRCTLLVLAGLLLAAPFALAQDPPETIPASYDFFKSPSGLSSEQDFAACPIPGIYFEFASEDPLSNCETFDDVVALAGVPLVTFNGYTVGVVDTAVYRTDELDFGDPTGDVTVTTPIELQALNLASTHPIKVKCDQGQTMWDVTVEIDQDTGPSHGEMEVTLEYPDNLGGTASSYLNVCPRVTFTRTDPGGSGSWELYPCDVGCDFNLLGETTWAYEAPPGEATGLRIPGLTADNFFFTDPLPIEEILALQSLEEADCPCVLRYPHLSENHKHQACLPCPCDSDTEPPVVTVPPPATMECSAYRASAFPTDECIEKPGFVCWDDWFDQVQCSEENGYGSPDCTNEPFTVKACAEEQPLQLQASCAGYPNVVDFKAEDCCGNDITVQSTLTVIDTTAPVVTFNDSILFTLQAPDNPPNGDYVCYDRAAFEAVGVPMIEEVCHDYTWAFSGCTSSQPDNGAADGNTTDDCHICAGANDTVQECAGFGAGEAICVRAERAGNDLDGRYYSIEVTATDECGLTSDPTLVGQIYVPHQPEPVPPPVCPVIRIGPPNGRDFTQIDIAAELGITGTVTILSIEQDEPVQQTNGDPAPDAEGVGTGIAGLRPQRLGSGDGRIYVITFTVDGEEPPCGGQLLVCVPHGGPDGECVDSGNHVDSTVP